MAKVAIQVDRKKLETSIQRAEENGPLKNYDELWTKAVAFYNAMNPPREITKSVVYLRVKEWAIVTKTKPGARGRAAGGTLSEEQKAAMQAGRKPGGRANRLKNDPEIQDGFKKIKANTPVRFESLVTKLTEHGSKSAGMALMCLQCTVYQPQEVKLCVCNDCPLFAFRPYRQKKADEVDVEGDEVEAILDGDDEEIAA